MRGLPPASGMKTIWSEKNSHQGSKQDKYHVLKFDLHFTSITFWSYFLTKNKFDYKCVWFGLKHYKMRYFVILIITVLPLAFSNCSAYKHGNKTKIQSSFSNFDKIGISKREFLRLYGAPISKDLYIEKGEKVETLYYAERIDKFIVVTGFKFKSDILKEQKTDKINYDLEKDLDEIYQKLRLKIMMKD
ncbi:MAG: hypothetical protein QM727_10755 [Niabella sp.]